MKNRTANGHEEFRLMLLEALDDNREIEFALNSHMYFATPQTDPPLPPCYGIFDVENKNWLFKGSIPELFTHPFPGGVTLNDNLEKFDFLYIL